MASLSKQPRTFTFQFGNPPAHSLDGRELAQLFEAVEAFERAETDVFILTGSGSTFCKGFDLADMRAITDHGELGRRLDQANRVVNRLAGCPKLTVAAINGHCLGGGLELAMACRFRLCSAKARLGLPEIWSGILPGLGGIHRLVSLAGEAKALEMIALGDLLTAEQAFSVGLVNRLCAPERFEEEVGAFVRGLQSADPILLREALRLVRSASRQTAADHVREASAAFLKLAPWVEKQPPWIEPVPEGIHLADDRIAVCLANSSFLPDGFSDIVLTAAERAELEPLSNTRRRQEWLAARAALKWLLQRQGIIGTWKEAEVLKDDTGKPFVRLVADDKRLPLDCSLSHKGERAIAALALVPGLRIGVDLELRSTRPFRIRSVFEHPRDSLPDVDDPETYFTVLWTLKEAAAKALGKGVRCLPTLACRGALEPGLYEIAPDSGERTLRAVQGAAGPYVISLAWEQLPVDDTRHSVHSVA